MGSAAACVAPSRTAAAMKVREDIDFMMKGLMAEALRSIERSVRFDGFGSTRYRVCGSFDLDRDKLLTTS